MSSASWSWRRLSPLRETAPRPHPRVDGASINRILLTLNEGDESVEGIGPAVHPSAFDDDGRWRSPPRPLPVDADGRLLAEDLRHRLGPVLATLPKCESAVILLRDIAGLTGSEVAAMLGIGEREERVLLNRARARVCTALAN